jgi:hypothetical protein
MNLSFVLLMLLPLIALAKLHREDRAEQNEQQGSQYVRRVQFPEEVPYVSSTVRVAHFALTTSRDNSRVP